MWYFISSWVLGGRDMGLSLYLDFGGHGFESGLCFWGVGSVFL